MRECGQIIRPSFMKLFFRMAERSLAELGDRYSLHGLFEDLAVVNAILIEDLPRTEEQITWLTTSRASVRKLGRGARGIGCRRECVVVEDDIDPLTVTIALVLPWRYSYRRHVLTVALFAAVHLPVDTLLSPRCCCLSPHSPGAANDLLYECSLQQKPLIRVLESSLGFSSQ